MEEFRKLLRGMSSWVQLIFLGLFVMTGVMILSIIISLYVSFSHFDPENPTAFLKSIEFIRIGLFFQSPLIFLLPALLWGYIFGDKTKTALKADTFPEWHFLISGIVLIFVIQPFVGFTAYYNNLIRFPESLIWLEKLMYSMEESNAETLNILLADTRPISIFLNFIIIAGFAGVCEEFFFRGTLQQIFAKITRNQHLAVWIVAFIFSAIHMQFYGFIPRMLLGAVLGYLFVWSGNIWVPVIVHTINNAMSIFANYYYGSHVLTENTAEDYFVPGDWLWVSIGSGVLSILLMIYLSRIYFKNRVERGDI